MTKVDCGLRLHKTREMNETNLLKSIKGTIYDLTGTSKNLFYNLFFISYFQYMIICTFSMTQTIKVCTIYIKDLIKGIER